MTTITLDQYTAMSEEDRMRLAVGQLVGVAAVQTDARGELTALAEAEQQIAKLNVQLRAQLLRLAKLKAKAVQGKPHTAAKVLKASRA